MHPILLRIGDLELRTYSVTAVLAMLGAMWVVLLEARRLGWKILPTATLVVGCTVLGFLGAHLFYAATRVDLDREAWWRMFWNFGLGYVWFGGFLTSWLLCQWFAWRYRIPYAQMWDVAAFAVLIALGVGRLGCLFNGCCYGYPTTLPWGVTPAFPTREGYLVPLHPLPVYESALQFIFFALLWRARLLNRRDGQTAARYLLLTPGTRFFLEFFRADQVRGFVWGWLSTSQAIALGILLFAAIWIALQKRKHPDFTLS